jgi:hypothetical protein
LLGAPRPRRDLVKRHLYLVPNSIVVSRGCPHHCDFCYKDAFFQGGKSFYTQAVDEALAEIDRLPGRHLYFLDDHLFGDARFASALFDGMLGMRRLWQAAGTVKSILQPGLLEKAVACGLRSLFVGFETLSADNLRDQHKYQNLNRRDNLPAHEAAIRRLHDLGVMVNASFVFGMDGDDPGVFERTVECKSAAGVETATSHPDPISARFPRPPAGAGAHHQPGLGSLRHAPCRFPANLMSAEALELATGVHIKFYRWGRYFRCLESQAWRADCAISGLFCRLEKVRAAVGLGNPPQEGGKFSAIPGSDPGRIRLDAIRKHGRQGDRWQALTIFDPDG